MKTRGMPETMGWSREQQPMQVKSNSWLLFMIILTLILIIITIIIIIVFVIIGAITIIRSGIIVLIHFSISPLEDLCSFCRWLRSMIDVGNWQTLEFNMPLTEMERFRWQHVEGIQILNFVNPVCHIFIPSELVKLGIDDFEFSGLMIYIIFDLTMTLRGSQLENSGDGQSGFDLADTIGVCTDTGH